MEKFLIGRLEAIQTWLSFWWGNLNVTSYTRFILIFVLVITCITENTYDYILYNSVWQARFCVEQVVLTGWESTNINTVSFLSCFVLNVCLIPQHHPACIPACMPPPIHPKLLVRPNTMYKSLCALFFFFFCSFAFQST